MKKTAHKKIKAVDKFLTWLNKNGAVFPNIYFQTYKNDERGVHARTIIQSHQPVIKIPQSMLIYAGMGEDTPWGKKSLTKFN